MIKNYRSKMRLALVATCLMLGFGATAQVDVAATGGVPLASYATLDAAFQAINAGTHTGAIGIGISASTTETGACVLNSSGAGAASYTSVQISPTVDGVSISGPTVTGRGLIELNGADNVTIDGDNPNTAGTNRNLSIVNTAANTVTFTAVIRIAAGTAAPYLDVNNIIVKNLILNGSATNGNTAALTSTTTGGQNTSFGVVVSPLGGITPSAIINTTSPINASAVANGFTVDNCAINQVGRGIAFLGNATTSSTGITLTNNTIGGAGALTTYPFTTPVNTVYSQGIFVTGTNAATITGNTLQNILSYISIAMNGIVLNSAIGTGTINVSNNIITAVTNNGTSNGSAGITLNSAAAGSAVTISNNTVSNIQDNTSTSQSGIQITSSSSTNVIISNNKVSAVYARSTGGYAARGILLNSGNGIVVRNNMIWDINMCPNNSATTTTFGARGILISSGSNHKIYNNSISLYGPVLTSANPDITTCIGISSSAQTGLDIRNNILSNTMTGGSAATPHVCIQIPSGLTSTFNLTLNNNAYYTGTTAGQSGAIVTMTPTLYTAPNFVAGSTAPASNLRSYTSTLSAAGTNDNASYASTNAAPFISSTNLHLNTASAELANVEQKGDVAVPVSTDIDGDVRPNASTTVPDMGADEVVAPGCVSANGGTIAPATLNKCIGQTASLVSTGASSGTGISYQWMVSTTSGSGYVNVSGGSGATTTSYTTAALTAGTYYYVLQTTCSFGPATGLSNEVTVTVNAIPTVTVTPTTGNLCQPGATAVALTAGGASTYAWAPAGSLSAATGTNVNALPGSTTTYTVTGTDLNGCTATATSVITVSEIPTVSSVTATPSSVCSGANSQLLATAGTTTSYAAVSIPHNAEVPTGVATNIFTVGDDAVSAAITIPFSFNFFGQTYTTLFAYTNGFLELGASSGSTSSYGATIPAAATPNNIIAGVWDDLNVTGTGTPTVRYFTNGTAPNRKFIIEYTAVKFYNGASNNGNVSFQIKLNEGSNIVEVHLTNVVDPSPSNHYVGIENATGTIGAAPAGRNPFTTNITTPEGWAFVPTGGTLTYAWTPASFLSSTTINNPMATGVTASTTYTVTASNGGCSSTGTVTITAGSALTSTSSTTPASGAICAGNNITLNSIPAGGGAPYTYAWTGPNSFASASQNAVVTAATVAASGTYTIVVTDNCGATSTSTVNVTINANPVVTATPPAATFCSGTSAIALTAGGASTYAWAPATGLSGTTGTTVNANPSATTTYTVTGTDGNGCVSTATAAVTATETPAITSVTASPAAVCAGSNTQITTVAGTAATYIASAPAFATVPCQATAGPVGDDVVQGPNAIGFTFNYFGVNYTQFGLSTNGNLQLGNGSGSAGNPAYSNAWTDAAMPAVGAPNNTIALAWDDWLTAAGEITWGMTGTAPNRKLVACFNTTGRGGGVADTLIGQVVLEETTNNIYLNITKKGVSTNSATQGIENATGTLGWGVTGRQNSTWSANNDSRLFAPPVLAYSWSPATYLSASNIASPAVNAITSTTTYTVTADNAGCSATGTVTVTANPVPVAPTAAGTSVCSGTSATLSATGTGTIGWYDASTGGTHLAGGSSFMTPALTSATTYYVQDSSAAGCTSARTAVTVNINALPTVSGMAMPAAVCAGDATSLMGSGAVSYTWTGGVTDGVSFTPATTATYTVTGTDGNGCMNTSTTTVTVNSLPTVNGTATPAAVCAGDATTLMGSGAVSYTWTGGVTNGVSFVPSSTSTYTVTGTDMNGCMATSTATVTYNALPAVTANATQNTVCENTMVTLTGGGASSYAWDNGVTDGAAFAATATTTYIVTGTDGNGCMNTASTTITVNMAPVVGLGADQSQCGGTVVLDAGNAGMNYVWSDASAGQTLTVGTTGTYYVTVTDGATGCFSSDTAMVTINSIPVVMLGADQTQCGGTVMLDAGNAGAAFTWNDLSTGQTLTVSTTGTYFVMVDNGTCIGSDTVDVTINTIPVVSFTPFTVPVCDNDVAFTLTNGSPAGGVYSGTGVSSGMFDPAASGSGMFLITYTVTDVNTCSASDTSTITVDLCSGIAVNKPSSVNFSVYPNPANGMVTVAISNTDLSEIVISIVDITGKEVYNEKHTNAGTEYNKQINIEGFAKGVYYVRMTTAHDSNIQKLIVH